MPLLSNHQVFWNHDRFAVVGHAAARGFPLLTYQGLKKLGKTAIAVDVSPHIEAVDGDATCRDLASIPEGVEAVVIEVPPEETAGWVEQAADQGVKDVWVHIARETPEAIALAE